MFLRLLAIETRKLLKRPQMWLEFAGLLGIIGLYFAARYAMMANSVRNGLELDLQVGIGLGYTQIIEFFFVGIFYGQSWTKWLMTNLHFSATFLLNSIGNRTANIPAHILAPAPALITAALYTLILLGLSLWLYRRKDVGG